VAVQVICVEAVPEIRHDRERQLGPRPGKPPSDRADAIELLPRPFVALLQLADGHSLGLKHDVLAVIELPVAGEDAALPVEPIEERRTGNGVTIAKRGRSMAASITKQTVSTKVSVVWWSRPNTKQP
jgi:hypothetical protein